LKTDEDSFHSQCPQWVVSGRCTLPHFWLDFWGMFSNPHVDRVRQLFADQFSEDARGVVYRKGQKDATIRVSEIDRDEFITMFNKRIHYAAWSIVPATFGLILLLVWLIPDADSPSAK
jgi:hypothetical protein